MSSNEVDPNKINYFKKINHKSAKKVNLCQKYFYKLNLSPKKCNIFQLMENGLANQDELEQVDNAISKTNNRRNELEKKQVECLKSMILHHKQVPEKWIVQNNYKTLLNKVMDDPIILSYAILSKDVFKKRSTSVSIDMLEYEKNFQNSTSSPKFISYINPYSKNYHDSIERHKLMKEYCYNLKNKKNRIHKNIKAIKNVNINQNNDNKDKNFYLKTDTPKDNILPYIFPGLKDIKRISKINKKKTDENLMMTSLYYDENNINKESKNKKDKEKDKDKEMNNDENEKTNEKTDDINKKKSIELPMIE